MEEMDYQLAVMDDDGFGCAITTSPAERLLVYDEENDEVIRVSRAEAAAGMLRFARSLGPGTPACAVWEQRALEIALGGTFK